jgi:hypothetical protein
LASVGWTLFTVLTLKRFAGWHFIFFQTDAGSFFAGASGYPFASGWTFVLFVVLEFDAWDRFSFLPTFENVLIPITTVVGANLFLVDHVLVEKDEDACDVAVEGMQIKVGSSAIRTTDV